MPKTWATLRDEVETELQDSGNSVWTAAEIDTQMEDAIRELSEYDPYVVKYIYEFETRTGTATSTTANAIVDATEAQFRATDVDKVFFNTTDRTWTIVTAFVSTSQLTLAEDIMAKDENYVMFNQDCWNNRQIYLGDIEDHIESKNRGVVKVEYYIDHDPPRYRNFSVDDNVLTVDIDFNPPDSKSDNLTSRKVEVNIWVAKRHQVSQLTDLAGAVDLVAGYSEHDTTIHVDSLAASETIAEDQEFTGAGLRGRYWLTAATTLSSNEGDISFWPPLENALADNDVLTFLGSSLNRKHERVLVELTAARALSSKASKLLVNANTAITSVASAKTALDLSAAKLTQQTTDITSGRTELAKADDVIDEGNTELDKVIALIEVAGGTLDTSRSTINTVHRGGPNTSGNYSNQAATELTRARSMLETARGYFEQARGDVELGAGLIRLGLASIEGSQANVNEAIGYLEMGTRELAITEASRTWERWADDKAERALRQLKRARRPNQIREYSTAR